MSNTDDMADHFDMREFYHEVVRTIQRYSSTHDVSGDEKHADDQRACQRLKQNHPRF
jgi:hypothetical protein